MSKHIIIHAVTIENGLGDLVYFLNWLKIYQQYRQFNSDKIVISIRIDDNQNAFRLLFELQEYEKTHPIFQFITLTYDQITKKYNARNNQHSIVNFILSRHSSYTSEEIMDLSVVNPYKRFYGIEQNDFVTTIYVSSCFTRVASSWSEIKNSNIIKILEFDGAAPDILPISMWEYFRYKNGRLGLSENNLGILTDINGINGQENFSVIFANLSDTVKQNIFQSKDITMQEAAYYLANTPSVFGYLQPDLNFYFLHTILMSPFIQDAIASGKMPLFFFTNAIELEKFPTSLKVAIHARQIRVVTMEWLNTKEYNTVNSLFLNHKTKSLIISSGDNSLSICLRVGKLPFYANKVKYCYSLFWSKCGIFRDLATLMQSAMEQGKIPNRKGYNACLKLMQFLAQEHISTPLKLFAETCFEFTYQNWQEQYYVQPSEHINQDSVDYFKNYLSPYIMQNYSFEIKGLPQILKILKGYDQLADSYNPDLQDEYFYKPTGKLITKLWGSCTKNKQRQQEAFDEETQSMTQPMMKRLNL